MDGIPLWATFSENDVFKIMMEDDLGGGGCVIKKLLAQTEVGRQRWEERAYYPRHGVRD